MFTRYMYLMRISYMYTGAIGFLVTYISAILLSYFLKLIKYYKNDNMYLDEAKTLVNPDLFLPPIAKMIRKRNDKISKSLADDNDSQKVDENKYWYFLTNFNAVDFFLLDLMISIRRAAKCKRHESHKTSELHREQK